MSISRIFSLIKKELRLGISNPLFLYVFIMPVLFTFVFQLIFGELWSEKPMFAVYDETGGVIVSELEKSKAITLIEVNSENEMSILIEDKKADMGIIFEQDSDDLLKEGKKITLKTYVNGEAYAKNRAIITATVISTLRNVTAEIPEVDFEQILLGEEKALTILEMMIPLLVIMAVLSAAFMLPATFIIREKEKRTINALLVTPSTITEILIAYGLLGVTLAVLMGIAILLLNGVWTQPFLMTLLLVLSAIFFIELGLIAGLAFDDINTLFANMKLFGILLYAPQLFIMFPKWPQWIAKIFPTYYILHPVFRISIFGESWSEVGWQILALAGFIVILLFVLFFMAKRFQKA